MPTAGCTWVWFDRRWQMKLYNQDFLKETSDVGYACSLSALWLVSSQLHISHSSFPGCIQLLPYSLAFLEIFVIVWSYTAFSSALFSISKPVWFCFSLILLLFLWQFSTLLTAFFLNHCLCWETALPPTLGFYNYWMTLTRTHFLNHRCLKIRHAEFVNEPIDVSSRGISWCSHALDVVFLIVQQHLIHKMEHNPFAFFLARWAR